MRPAREEMRLVIGSRLPEGILGFDKDQDRGCRRKGTDYMEFLCQLYDAKAACGRYFVHERTRLVPA